MDEKPKSADSGVVTTIEFVGDDGQTVNGIALIDRDGRVWRTFARPWWDIASWLWWWLSPGEKKWVVVRRVDRTKVRVRAVRLARKHVRVGGLK